MPKIVDRSARRRQIITAALPVIAEKGIAGVTIAEIADAADIGKGTIYEYFSSKEEIVTAAYSAYMGSYVEDMAPLIKQKMDPLAKFRAIFLSTVSWVLRDDRMMQISLDYAAITRREPEKYDLTAVEEMLRTFHGLVTRLFAEARDNGQIKKTPDEHLVTGLLSAVDGIILHAYAIPNYQPEPVITALIDTIIEGLS